jgi:hypothetical protein
LRRKKYGEECRLAPKRVDTGLVSQEQCRGILRKVGCGMVEINGKSLFLREGAVFHSFRVCNTGFHDLLREKLCSLFMSLGWSLSSTDSFMMC